MPKTRGESIFFTSITAWMMVYVMTLYNTVLATGTFTNLTFFIALKNMWIEYIIIGLLAYFVSGHLAKCVLSASCSRETDQSLLFLQSRPSRLSGRLHSPV